MALFKFRKSSSTGSEPSASGSAAPLSLDALRRRARNRLIGAAALVLLGVVGFPLLFDTQPRPVVADIQIDIPEKAKSKPLAMPAPVPLAPEAASAPLAASAPIAADPPPKAEPKPTPPPKPEAKPTPAPATATAPKAAEADKARALLEGRDAGAASAGRFVVQVGAYSDAAKLRDVRQKLENAHLKTYTQAVQTKDGARTRVRVGPFATQAEADKAALRVKALDLPAAVLKM